MHPEDKKLLKKVVLTTGFVLLMGVGVVGPCISDATVHTTPATVTECDGSCPWPNPAGATPAPMTEIITADNWAFTLPSDNWKGRDMEMPNDSIRAIRLSPEPNSVMVLFIKEDVDGTLADYAVDSIRAFDQLGYKLNGVRQFPMGDNKFVLVQMSKDDRVIWSWITVKDSSGYVLSCGGDINVDAGASQHDLCFSVAQTLVIK